jgi:hypothetical protein
MNDEHENNTLVLQVVNNSQDFQVYWWNFSLFHISYTFI